jgi:hypothetical protein
MAHRQIFTSWKKYGDEVELREENKGKLCLWQKEDDDI